MSPGGAGAATVERQVSTHHRRSMRALHAMRTLVRHIEQTKEDMNRSLTTAVLALASLMAAAHAQAQVAGTTTIGVEVTKLQFVASGWSARKQILGKVVYNEEGEQVGKIDDLIIAPDSAVSFVIVGAGGFVGLKRHHVAIPAGQLAERDGNFVLPGATKAVIKALPPFEYAKRPAPQADAQEAPGAASE
jgi:hypothetical protein